MAELTDTITINELREAASQEISLSTTFPVDINNETVRIYLSQILALLDENAITPIGVFLPFSGNEDQIPDGWAAAKGQAFDPVAFPILGSFFPDGIIQDMRGIAAVGAKDGEDSMLYEADGIISHFHTMNHDHPAVTTSSDSHNHTTSDTVARYRLSLDNTGQGVYEYDTSNSGYRLGYSTRTLTTTTDSHTHTADVAAYTGNTGAIGNAENTIKNRKFHWIVRLQ